MTDIELVFNVAVAWDEWSHDPMFPFEPGCCLNGSRVVMEVLRDLGVRAKPVSVQFVLFNAFGWSAYEAGVPVAEWPHAAWSVGVGPNMEPPSNPDRWRGHLMLEGSDWLLDISARQFHRPGRINVETPLILPTTLPPDGWSISHGSNGNVLMIARFPANNLWREAAGWKRPHVAERTELTRRVQRVLERNTDD